jgi:hypothetical protein
MTWRFQSCLWKLSSVSVEGTAKKTSGYVIICHLRGAGMGHKGNENNNSKNLVKLIESSQVNMISTLLKRPTEIFELSEIFHFL